MELRRGLEQLRSGEFALAEAHFERAHSWAPHRPEVCYALGRERLRAGELEEAERLLRSAWQGDRTLISAAATLARCLGLYQELFEDAYGVLDDADFHSQYGDPSVAVVRSELLLTEGRLEEAREAANSALLRCDPADDDGAAAAARSALARVENEDGIESARRGAHDQALFAFRRASNLDPSWSSPHVNMGAAFADLGKRDRARICYEAAVKLEPHNAIAHYNLGLLLADQGELEDASCHLENALELAPDMRAAATALAEISINMGEHARAVELLIELLEGDPASAEAWVDLAVALSAGGDVDGAEESCRHAIDLDPEHVEAYCRLADVLGRQGRYMEAAVLVKRACAIDPDLAGTLLASSIHEQPERPR